MNHSSNIAQSTARKAKTATRRTSDVQQLMVTTREFVEKAYSLTPFDLINRIHRAQNSEVLGFGLSKDEDIALFHMAALLYTTEKLLFSRPSSGEGQHAASISSRRMADLMRVACGDRDREILRAVAEYLVTAFDIFTEAR